MKRITQPSQLKLIKDFPSRMGMFHRIKNEKIEYKENWRDNHWYLAPYWRKMSHIHNTINRSCNLNLNQLTYKLKKIAGPIVPFSKILNLFELPDRNGEYRNAYGVINGWNGTTRSCNIERKINSDLTIDVRVAECRRKREPMTNQEKYKMFSDRRKAHKTKYWRIKTSGKVQNSHKKEIKVQGYTKEDRISYMCKHNPHSKLYELGLVIFQGPLRKVGYTDPSHRYTYYLFRKRIEPKTYYKYVY